MPTEVVVEAVQQGPGRQKPVVILRERRGTSTAAIELTQHEADALAMAFQRVRTARPLTHDLVATVVARLGARVVEAHVVRRGGHYLGVLRLDCDGEERRIACRASDALTVALKVRVPVFCGDEVFAGDHDAGDGELGPRKRARLAAFRDFINSLDLEGFGTR